MYDNSIYYSELSKYNTSVISNLQLEENQYALATVHRDHNTDINNNLESIIKELVTLSKELKILLPLHPRTKKIIFESE